MDELKIEKEGNIEYLIFSRKEKSNALTMNILRKLNEELENLSNDIKYIVFKGDGQKFGAGVDLNMLLEIQEDENKARNFVNELNKLFKNLINLDKITIALVEGFAIGAHLEILVFTDLNIAEGKAYFSTGGARIGLIPAELSSLYLLYLGRNFWKYIITAERFDSNKALEIGLIDYVTDEPIKKLKEIIQVIDSNDYIAIQSAKKLRRYFMRTFLENLDKAREEFLNLILHGNVKERAKKFLEKR